VSRICLVGSLLRRSKIFIAFGVKNCASSVGATYGNHTIIAEYAAPTELAMIWVPTGYKDVAPTELVRFCVAILATFMKSLRDKWNGDKDEGALGSASVLVRQCPDEQDLVPTEDSWTKSNPTTEVRAIRPECRIPSSEPRQASHCRTRALTCQKDSPGKCKPSG
jgi:hypothetical protein